MDALRYKVGNEGVFGDAENGFFNTFYSLVLEQQEYGLE